MRKIAFLVHRYGEDIVGGAEGYTKDLAERLSQKYEVTVFTTTSIDYVTWRNYYPVGQEYINNVCVKRYNVENERDMEEFSKICVDVQKTLNAGQQTSDIQDKKWIEAEGPFSPKLIEELKNEQDNYDMIVVVTYIYYLAVMAIPEVAKKVLFISTAHDEPWINMSMFKRIFNLPRYFGFLTDAERALVHSKFNNQYIPYEILGTGIVVPECTNVSEFREKFNLMGDYLIYVGRLDESKGCKELCNYFINYKCINDSDLKLVLVGKGDMQLPECEDIIATGFISDDEKYDAIAGAFAMVTPSPYESLCIALLEGMALGIPIIANEKCHVLKQHCIMSGAGLYYDSWEDFSGIVDYLRNHEHEYNAMKLNGKDYVQKNYTWDIVERKIEKICREINTIHNKITMLDESCKIYADMETIIQPVYPEAITVVTAADDNYGKYAGITVNSIISNMSEKQNYDILILTNNMSDMNISKIMSMNSYSNVSIRFVFVNSVMEHLNVKISNNYKIITYYRLLIQKLMPTYEKVIYMDSDVIVNVDLNRLWSIDIGDNYIAGTYDSLIAAWQAYDSGMQSYFEAIGVCKSGEYVQAGVLLMNLKKINEDFEALYLLRKACSETYIFADQDLLNIAFKGKIKYIDSSWDVLNLNEEGRALCERFLPASLKIEFVNAEKQPYAVHYVEQSFPCNKKDRKFGDLFWKYTYNTPFSKDIEDIYQNNMKDNCQDIFIQKKNDTVWNKIKRRMKRNNIIKLTDSNSVLKDMKVLNQKISNEKNIIVLMKEETMSGPNIFMGKGKHNLFINISMEAGIEQKVMLYAGARHILLKEFIITSGKNDISFELQRNYIDVEIVLVNESKDEIRITEMRLI